MVFSMKFLLACLGWCLLLAICWPVALLAVLLFPVVWLVCLPFRLAAAALSAAIALVTAILFLPARLLGSGRPL